jgi:hypothetical protein
MFCLCGIADNAGVIVNPKGEMKGIVLKVLMVSYALLLQLLVLWA